MSHPFGVSCVPLALRRPLFQRGGSPRAPRHLLEECPHEAAQPPMGFLRAPGPLPQECSRPFHMRFEPTRFAPV
jgi:hypothetical protein